MDQQGQSVAGSRTIKVNLLLGHGPEKATCCWVMDQKGLYDAGPWTKKVSLFVAGSRTIKVHMLLGHGPDKAVCCWVKDHKGQYVGDHGTERSDYSWSIDQRGQSVAEL